MVFRKTTPQIACSIVKIPAVSLDLVVSELRWYDHHERVRFAFRYLNGKVFITFTGTRDVHIVVENGE